jgi:hypothetical protein
MRACVVVADVDWGLARALAHSLCTGCVLAGLQTGAPEWHTHTHPVCDTHARTHARTSSRDSLYTGICTMIWGSLAPGLTGVLMAL